MRTPSCLPARASVLPLLVLLLLTAWVAAGPAAGAADPCVGASWALSSDGASGPSPRLVTGINAPAGPAGSPPSTVGGGGDRSWPQMTLGTVVPPVLYDLDGDDLLEVIAADERYVYVFGIDGSIWPGWPVNIGGAMMQAAVADLDDDGDPDIVIASTAFTGPMLHAFDASAAELPGYPVPVPYQSFTNTTCPVVADLDGDSWLDAGVASEVGVSFFDRNGDALPGWPYLWPVSVNNPQWSAPAVGDIDGDGSLEVAVGNVNYPNWGVHVIRADGTAHPGWPQVTLPVYASPALADLNEDGDLEIIVQEGDPGSQGYRLWVWAHTGTPLPGWPKTISADGQSSRSSPAVADVDGDGTLEIVSVTSDGKVHILRANGSYYPGYPLQTAAVQPISSPAVLDIDNDGPEEIFFTYWSANSQYVSGWRLDGSVLAGFPKLLLSGTDMNAHASVHVANADGDSGLELATSALSSSSGRVWVLDVDGSSAGGRADWPKMRRDAANLGAFPSQDPGAAPDETAGGAGGIALSAFRPGPNPLPRGSALHLSGLPDRPGRITLLDPRGASVRSVALAAPRALGFEELFGSAGGPNGVYFLRWEGASGSATRRIVVIGK